MPKNKKPAGGRPSKNFEPRTGAKAGRPSRPAASKPGSKSPGHRGYRPDEAPAPKRRWDAAERAERAAGRDDRAPRTERDERPRFNRDDRAPRTERPAYGDRPAYGNRDDRAPRTERDERPRFNRDDRAPRQDRGDRPYRPTGDRDERPRFNRDDRAPRSERDDRPRFNRDDRAPRQDRGDRPSYGNRDDRAPRRFDRDNRAPRQDRGDRPSYGFDRGADRGERSSSSFYPDKSKAARFEAQEDVVLEKLEAVMTTASEAVDSSFADLGLGDNICRQLAGMGAASPFPIQVATIPDVLAKRDVLGRGKTGSGKTIAFGAPIVERLMENEGGKNRKMGRAPRALILAPTRELAMQIDRTVQPIARSVGLFTTTIYGGVPQARQVGALQRGVDIIIATPGRLEDLVQQRRIDLRNITITVLDEADHMCDLGFLEPVQRILRQTDPNGQRLLFSATLDKGVAAIVDEFLVDPAVHEVAGEDQASSTIDHRVLVIEHRDKMEVIRQLTERDGKTLVFSRTRAYAEQLADDLDDSNIPATSLHGDLNQSRRTRNLQMLTSGRVDVLVATDVAARGIHIDDIDLVIQADAPDEYKTYLHRAGRTGRAGRQGVVVTLITKPRMRRTQELLARADIEAEMIMVRPGDELISQIARGEA
jgi:superfamily II DNA/RNA helicase